MTEYANITTHDGTELQISLDEDGYASWVPDELYDMHGWDYPSILAKCNELGWKCEHEAVEETVLE